MVDVIRTSEDHNGDGTGLPEFPRKHTELTRDSFAASGSDLVHTHVLHDDTSAVEILYVPSTTVARLYGPARIGVSRIIPNAIVGRSVLRSREIPLKITGHDAETSFDVDIWEH